MWLKWSDGYLPSPRRGEERESWGVEALRSHFSPFSAFFFFIFFPFAKCSSGQKVFHDARGGENTFEGALCQTLRRAAPGGSGAPQVVWAAPGPQMPRRGGGEGGGVGGCREAQPDGRWAPHGRCQSRGAVPSLLPPFAASPGGEGGVEWSLRCPWTWWVGCSPRGTRSGNKSQAASAERNRCPLSSPALLPSAPLPGTVQPSAARRAVPSGRRRGAPAL